MNKLIGIIGFDILMMSTPLLIGIAPELVDWVSYILITMSSLTILTLIFYKEDSDELKKIELKHRERPQWWNFYDLISDGVFASMWLIHGFYTIVFLLILVKIFIIIKIPNYYKGV